MKLSSLRRTVTLETITVVIDALGKDIDPEQLTTLAIAAVDEKRRGIYGKNFERLSEKLITPAIAD